MQFMYINKKYKLKYRERLRILKQYMNYRCNPTYLAKKYNISRQSVYKIIKRYKNYGLSGLEDHKPGNLRNPLNPVFYANVVSIRKATAFGACRIEKYFKSKGFKVSHNKINQVLHYEGLLNKKMGRKKRPKYVRYEAKNINDQWHIDWSIDPLSKKNLLAIIDDKSRFIVFAELFDSANAANSALGLEYAIKKYGTPKEIVSDNGSHFKDIYNKTVNRELLRVEKKYGIKHIFIRPGHPESNGKIERWFGSYKREIKIMQHEKVKDCLSWVEWYNFERIHQSLNYETPAHIYLSVN